MQRPHVHAGWRPGLRALVLSISGVLIVVAAILVSANVADHVQQTAVAEAVRTTEAVVGAYIDPSVTPEVFANPSGPAGSAVNASLERLVSTGDLLRIKVWGLDGTVVFSDLPALRGRQFPVAGDLRDIFEGHVSTEFSRGTDEENVFERGLAEEFLSIYLPSAPRARAVRSSGPTRSTRMRPRS